MIHRPPAAETWELLDRATRDHPAPVAAVRWSAVEHNLDTLVAAAGPVRVRLHGIDAPERHWNDYKDVDLHGKIAVVHNGIIENFAALRAELEAAGYPFRSETDSEAAAHLVAREMEAAQREVGQLRFKRVSALSRCIPRKVHDLDELTRRRHLDAERVQTVVIASEGGFAAVGPDREEQHLRK